MENTLITSKQIQEFLQDFEQNSVIELLEEDSKEQNEIFQIAEARGIKLKDRHSIAGFKTIYTFADKANLNKARLPKKELLKALPTLVGTPIDIDHQRNYVVGHYIDYRYIVKDESVVAYGVFYKANFADEWTNAQKLFKAGKLTTSYEIFSPKNKRKILTDGTFELHDMEIGGGALLYKEKPAFTDAHVLELAKINIAKESDNLVYASKYKCEDLIIHGETVCNKCGKCDLTNSTEEKKIAGTEKLFTKEELLTKKDEIKTEIKVEEKPKIKCQGCNTELDYLSIPEKGMGYIECPICKKNIDQTGKVLISKIKCANCQHEFDKPQFITSEMKCSECFAIINDKGELLYPPQIIDFNISCSSCSSRNWRLLKKEEYSAELKCLSCAKKYAITFKKVEPNAVLDMVQFLHIGHVSCKQCGHYISYSGTSKSTVYDLKCGKCGLTFTHDIVKDGQIKQLSTITEIVEPVKASIETSSPADELKIDNSAIKEEAKGEIKMEKESVENIVEVASIPTPIAKSEVAEATPVIPADNPVVAKEEEKPVEPIEPKTETTSETIIETVVEEVKVEPVTEAKIEEVVVPKVEEKIEAPVEAKTEDSALPPEVKKHMEEMMKEGMPAPEAIKKAWTLYKKELKASKTSRKKIAS